MYPQSDKVHDIDKIAIRNKFDNWKRHDRNERPEENIKDDDLVDSELLGQVGLRLVFLNRLESIAQRPVFKRELPVNKHSTNNGYRTAERDSHNVSTVLGLVKVLIALHFVVVFV